MKPILTVILLFMNLMVLSQGGSFCFRSGYFKFLQEKPLNRVEDFMNDMDFTLENSKKDIDFVFKSYTQEYNLHEYFKFVDGQKWKIANNHLNRITHLTYF